jgi:hypothetical protein
VWGRAVEEDRGVVDLTDGRQCGPEALGCRGAGRTGLQEDRGCWLDQGGGGSGGGQAGDRVGWGGSGRSGLALCGQASLGGRSQGAGVCGVKSPNFRRSITDRRKLP